MTQRRDVHLVGSVPLASASDVFRTTAKALGPLLAKIPDGETGQRTNWVGFQYGVLAKNPALVGRTDAAEQAALETSPSDTRYDFPKLSLRPGVELELGSLGYKDNAIASYQEFARLKSAGVIDKATRFQVSLPTPLAPVAAYIDPASMFAVLPVYAAAMIGELMAICAEIPHDQLAIQWDVAVEFGLYEGAFPPPPGDWRGMLMNQFGQLGNAVPTDVALGFHLCYGDAGHKHFIEPKDTANLVEVANGIAKVVTRPLQWLHMPVPRSRHDDAYFAPLAQLKLHPETKLFLGLVHATDGVDGARRRIAAAEKVVTNFGIGTECGLGRRDPKSIPALLALHAELA